MSARTEQAPVHPEPVLHPPEGQRHAPLQSPRYTPVDTPPLSLSPHLDSPRISYSSLRRKACAAPSHVKECNGKGDTIDHFTPQAIGRRIGWTREQIIHKDNLQSLSRACHDAKDSNTNLRVAVERLRDAGVYFTIDEHVEMFQENSLPDTELPESHPLPSHLPRNISVLHHYLELSERAANRRREAEVLEEAAEALRQVAEAEKGVQSKRLQQEAEEREKSAEKRRNELKEHEVEMKRIDSVVRLQKWRKQKNKIVRSTRDRGGDSLPQAASQDEKYEDGAEKLAEPEATQQIRQAWSRAARQVAEHAYESGYGAIDPSIEPAESLPEQNGQVRNNEITRDRHHLGEFAGRPNGTNVDIFTRTLVPEPVAAHSGGDVYPVSSSF